jgi:hypothetical protein
LVTETVAATEAATVATIVTTITIAITVTIATIQMVAPVAKWNSKAIATVTVLTTLACMQAKATVSVRQAKLMSQEPVEVLAPAVKFVDLTAPVPVLPARSLRLALAEPLAHPVKFVNRMVLVLVLPGNRLRSTFVGLLVISVESDKETALALARRVRSLNPICAETPAQTVKSVTAPQVPVLVPLTKSLKPTSADLLAWMVKFVRLTAPVLVHQIKSLKTTLVKTPVLTAKSGCLMGNVAALRVKSTSSTTVDHLARLVKFVNPMALVLVQKVSSLPLTAA